MQRISFIIGFVILLVSITGAVVFFLTRTKVPTKNFDEFAKCLAQKGVVMYGAKWCSHCQNQKQQFGDSFGYIKYVECPEEIKLCTEKGIQGFPTWEMPGGQKLIGEQNFETLSMETGCQLP